YEVPAPTGCEYLNRGLNDTYLLECGEKRFIIRAYRHAWRSESEILFELELLEHLKRTRAPVAAPIRTREGRLLWQVEAPEGRRYVALFEYAEGKPSRQADYGPD